jgi:hypothetical protein
MSRKPFEEQVQARASLDTEATLYALVTLLVERGIVSQDDLVRLKADAETVCQRNREHMREQFIEAADRRHPGIGAVLRK